MIRIRNVCVILEFMKRIYRICGFFRQRKYFGVFIIDRYTQNELRSSFLGYEYISRGYIPCQQT